MYVLELILLSVGGDRECATVDIYTNHSFRERERERERSFTISFFFTYLFFFSFLN